MINKKLEKLARKHKVSFVHLTDLSKESGLNSKFTYDSVHLSTAGYQSWISDIKHLLISRN